MSKVMMAYNGNGGEMGMMTLGSALARFANAKVEEGCITVSTVEDLCSDVERIVGHDGSVNIRVIVESAIADDVRSAREIAAIVREARAAASAEAARG